MSLVKRLDGSGLEWQSGHAAHGLFLDLGREFQEPVGNHLTTGTDYLDVDHSPDPVAEELVADQPDQDHPERVRHNDRGLLPQPSPPLKMV